MSSPVNAGSARPSGAIELEPDAVPERLGFLGHTRVGFALRRHLPSWPADTAPDAFVGQQYAVTGATSGLGAATAEKILAGGGEVHLLVRDLAKAEAVTRRWVDRYDAANRVHLWRCDLSDLETVRACAAELNQAAPALNGLIHNAGVLARQPAESSQGTELTMAVHVVAPVVLTEALLPLMEPGANVLFVTSARGYAAALTSRSLGEIEPPYSGMKALARANRAIMELLPLLQSRWSQWGEIQVHAMHPGVARTPGFDRAFPKLSKYGASLWRRPDEAVDTTVWLLAQQLDGGRIWHDRRPRPGPGLNGTGSDASDILATWRWVGERGRIRG